ncbi:hypothetical protein DFH09DRAFT_1386324 [Mycena vulgaris]|nr:hypothetical protein DFH09DRAFT_1386324 [Mycena vulgaris]
MDMPRQPHRVPELWFEDGNLVIQAGNTQQLVEGCPLVHLPDPENQAVPFLRAIFEPEFFLPFPAPTDLDTIAACIQLSHKYGVDYLYRRALVHLSSAYPTRLSDADEIATGDAVPARWTPSWSVPDSLVYNIYIIQLARQVEVPWILPYSFYALSTYFCDMGVEVFHDAVYNGVSATLSLQDQQSFLRGHNIQSSSMATKILRFLFDPTHIEGCTNPTTCIPERLGALRHALSFFESDPSSPLTIWNPVI